MRAPVKLADRRHFIGGSDARIIMGNDEAAQQCHQLLPPLLLGRGAPPDRRQPGPAEGLFVRRQRAR